MSKNHLRKTKTQSHYNSLHSPKSPAHKILIAFLLNLSFSIFEFVGGVLTNSVAITSDAVHDLGDAISIGIAYFLERYSRKTPDDKYTYGYLRYSVIGSLLTTIILIAGSIIVIVSAISRIIHPVEVNYNGMIVLAIFGVIINFAAAYYTHDGHSLNQKSVNLHMLEDVLGWVVVLVGAVVMRFTNISLLDPILSVAVALFILVSALKNFREILNLFLEKTPSNISLDELRQHLLSVKGVEGVHHIHVWSIDGNQNFATLHVVTNAPSHGLKDHLRHELRTHGISHATIELENPDEHCDNTSCVLEPAHHHHH